MKKYLCISNVNLFSVALRNAHQAYISLVVVNTLWPADSASSEPGTETHMIPRMLLIHLAEIHSWPQKSGIYMASVANVNDEPVSTLRETRRRLENFLA